MGYTYMKLFVALSLFVAATLAHGRRWKNYDCEAPIANVQDVRLPFSASFAEANDQYATLMGEASFLEPDLVAMCANEAEVVEAVKWARACHYKVSIRSGGHSYNGYSSCGPWHNNSTSNGCMVIDVSQLEHFAIDTEAKQATFGVGWILKDMYLALAQNGWAVPGGMCNTVGVGGHYQTSGIGMFGKSFGLGIDYVASFRIVDARGRIRSVDENSDPDLFWAVLGGGAGSWGVILDYTYNVIEAANYPHSEFRLYNFIYTHDNFVRVMNTWLELHQNPELARDLTSLFVVGTPDDGYLEGNYTHVISIFNVWTGVEAGEFTDEHYNAYIQPLIDAGGAFLQHTFIEAKIPLQMVLPSIAVDFDKSPFHYHVAAKVSKQSAFPYFDENFAEITATHIDQRLATPDMFTSIQLQMMGSIHDSQINLNTGRSAYAIRDLVIILDDWLFFKNAEDSDIAADLVASYMDDLEEHYPNPPNTAAKTFMTPRTMDADIDVMEDQWHIWFPTQAYYDQLRRIKRRVDRHDLFSSAMTIPPRTFRW